MRVLIATRLKKTPEEAEEAFQVERAVQQKGLVPVRDDEVDWGELFARCGGRDAAYAHMARQHDHLALIEGWDEENEYFVAKGQHSLALCFMEECKSVSVWRGGVGRMVRGFTPLTKNWSGPYMRADVEGADQ